MSALILTTVATIICLVAAWRKEDHNARAALLLTAGVFFAIILAHLLFNPNI